MKFTPLDPEVLENPYPHYAALRNRNPVHWDETLSSWVVFGYEDNVRALRDVELFASDFRRVGIETPDSMLSVQTLDPPDHAPIRHLLVNGFKKAFSAQLADFVGGRARHLLEPHAGGEPFDFVSDVASPLALDTITAFLGVDPPDLAWFEDKSEDLVHSMDAGLRPEAESPGLAARQALSDLVATWYADPPGEGMIGAIARDLDDLAPPPLVLNASRALLHAGYESSGRLMGNSIRALSVCPPAQARMRAAKGELPNAIDELVRFDGPVQAESRAVTRNTTISGQEVAQGDILVLMIGAANRDPARFVDPETLDLQRNPKMHLGFGLGIHSCLGAPLALLQARTLLQIIYSEFDGVELAGHPVQRDNATLRGLAYLPIRLTSRK